MLLTSSILLPLALRYCCCCCWWTTSHNAPLLIFFRLLIGQLTIRAHIPTSWFIVCGHDSFSYPCAQWLFLTRGQKKVLWLPKKVQRFQKFSLLAQKKHSLHFILFVFLFFFFFFLTCRRFVYSQMQLMLFLRRKQANVLLRESMMKYSGLPSVDWIR